MAQNRAARNIPEGLNSAIFSHYSIRGQRVCQRMEHTTFLLPGAHRQPFLQECFGLWINARTNSCIWISVGWTMFWATNWINELSSEGVSISTEGTGSHLVLPSVGLWLVHNCPGQQCFETIPVFIQFLFSAIYVHVLVLSIEQYPHRMSRVVGIWKKEYAGENFGECSGCPLKNWLGQGTYCRVALLKTTTTGRHSGQSSLHTPDAYSSRVPWWLPWC